jgi:hypothetical protein
MKKITQLDAYGYFVGPVIADESPLETGVYLIPANAIDAPLPDVPNGMVAKWSGEWVFELIPEPEPVVEVDLKADWTYVEYRKSEYPPIGDQLDALWKGGDAAAEMLAQVQAVKAKYPKPTE